MGGVAGGSVGSGGVGYTRHGAPAGGPSMPSSRYDTSEPDSSPPLYDNVIMLPGSARGNFHDEKKS